MGPALRQYVRQSARARHALVAACARLGRWQWRRSLSVTAPQGSVVPPCAPRLLPGEGHRTLCRRIGRRCHVARFGGRILAMSPFTPLTSCCGLRSGKPLRRALSVCSVFALWLLPLGCTPRSHKPADAASGTQAGNALQGAPGSTPPLSPAQAKVRNSPTDVAARLALANEEVTAGETFAGIEQREVARALGDTDSNLLRDLAHWYD